MMCGRGVILACPLKVVASKNSLLGLDLHEPSPPTQCNGRGSRQKSPTSSLQNPERRKVVADAVVKSLSSYYKGKKISSKVNILL